MRILITVCLVLLAKVGFCQLDFDGWAKKGKHDKYIIPMLGNASWTNKENIFIQETLTQFANNRREASNHFISLGKADRQVPKMDLESAMRNFNKAWLIDSTNADVYLCFGDLYLTFFYENKVAKKAGVEYLDKGLQYNSKNPSLLFTKGGIYLKEFQENGSPDHKLDSATQLILESFELAPNHASAYQLTICYFLKNDCANAKKFLNETIDRGGKGYTEVISKRIENKCTENGIKLPSLDKTWGHLEYKAALEYLNSLSVYDLPQLGDSKSKNVFNKLTSYENLKVYTDQSLTPDERFKEVYPYFNLFPELLDIYSKARLNNESVVISQFIMESLKLSTYLAQEKFSDWSESKVKKFRTDFGEQIFVSSGGALDVLSVAEEENIDSIYIVDFATWFKDNFIVLYNWIDENGKRECEGKVKLLSKRGSPKEIRKLMKDLENRLD